MLFKIIGKDKMQIKMVDGIVTKFGYMPKFWNNSTSLNTIGPILVGVRITRYEGNTSP